MTWDFYEIMVPVDVALEMWEARREGVPAGRLLLEPRTDGTPQFRWQPLPGTLRRANWPLFNWRHGRVVTIADSPGAFRLVREVLGIPPNRSQETRSWLGLHPCRVHFLDGIVAGVTEADKFVRRYDRQFRLGETWPELPRWRFHDGSLVSRCSGTGGLRALRPADYEVPHLLALRARYEAIRRRRGDRAASLLHGLGCLPDGGLTPPSGEAGL